MLAEQLWWSGSDDPDRADHTSKQKKEDPGNWDALNLSPPAFHVLLFPAQTLLFLRHLPSSQPSSTWDQPQCLRDEHTANNLRCLSKEVRSFPHTVGTWNLLLCLLRRCQKNILICNLWLEEWQTDRHMCRVHICFPALDLRSTAELRRESKRKAALQQMVLLKEPRWNSLCYKCSLVFFQTPVGSGPPAGLHSNVLRPNEYISMHARLSDECSHLTLSYQTDWDSGKNNELSWELFWKETVITGCVIGHLRWLYWDYEFSLKTQFQGLLFGGSGVTIRKAFHESEPEQKHYFSNPRPPLLLPCLSRTSVWVHLNVLLAIHIN